MIPSSKITDYSYIVSSRFEAINSKYISIMAQHINTIGKLTATDLHRLEQMAIMDQNIAEINDMLAKQTKLALNDIYAIYDQSALSEYGDAQYMYKANGKMQLPFEDNVHIQRYLEAMKVSTANTFVNLANSTSIQDEYKDMVDIAVQSVSSGVEDYTSAIRSVLREKAVKGMRVHYASGLTRRLDSAVRMNILDGVRSINNNVRMQCGKEFGADGVEIDAHGLCAEDHLPYQGRQYSLKQFEYLQGHLKRPISTCNCHHGISYILLGVSPKAYTDNELDDMKRYSEELIDINGKQMTRYEASQLMRKLETQMRYEKDKYIAGKALNDTFLTTKSELQLKHLQKRYRDVSNASGLQKRYDKAYVPGYRGSGSNVKPKDVSIKATN